MATENTPLIHVAECHNIVISINKMLDVFSPVYRCLIDMVRFRIVLEVKHHVRSHHDNLEDSLTFFRYTKLFFPLYGGSKIRSLEQAFKQWESSHFTLDLTR